MCTSLLELPWRGESACVRIDLRQKLITVKMYDRNGTYSAGELSRNVEIPLTDEQAEQFLAALDESSFWIRSYWEPCQRSGTVLDDGTQSILEGVDQGHYHMIIRRDPIDSQVLAVFELVWEWAGLGQGLGRAWARVWRC
ncbi:MAG: hypothetical protein ACI8W8_002705 [Rhodothermales bacterium]|jgi:hypothetical protein